jgi:hypothetical protein
MANLLEDERFGGTLESLWEPEELELLAEAAEESEPHEFAKSAVDHALELGRQAAAIHAQGDPHLSMKHAEKEMHANRVAASRLGAIGHDEKAAGHDARADAAQRQMAHFAAKVGNLHHSPHLKDMPSLTPTRTGLSNTAIKTKRSQGVVSRVLKTASMAVQHVKDRLKSAAHRKLTPATRGDSPESGVHAASHSASTGAQSPLAKQGKSSISVPIHATKSVSGIRSKVAPQVAAPVDHMALSKHVNAMSKSIHSAEDDPTKSHGLHAASFKQLHGMHMGAAKAALDAGNKELSIAHTHAAISALNKHFDHKELASKEAVRAKEDAEAMARHAERVAAGGGPRAGGGYARPEGGVYGQPPPKGPSARVKMRQALNKKYKRGH